MTLRLFTLVHGEPYLTWMERGLLASLMWPKNRAALKWAHWHIYTTQSSQDRAVEIAKRLEIPIQVNIVPEAWSGELLAGAVRHLFMDCAKTGDQFLVAPPDTIFGEQSVETMLAIARTPKLVISVAPVRVNAEFMDTFSGAPLTNAQLVGQAWRNLHRTWQEADMNLKFTNSFAGGVSWQKVAPDLYQVTHLLPTPFLVDPTPHDSEWFRQYGAPGSFDHLWPARVVDEGRQRFIASSDAAFAVEITEKDKNIPVLYPNDERNPTNYLGHQQHNHINRNTSVTFRAES